MSMHHRDFLYGLYCLRNKGVVMTKQVANVK